MGFRLDGRRRGALEQLWRAGDTGLPALLVNHMGPLLGHGLAEEYRDEHRVITARYRLTPAGRALARQLFDPCGIRLPNAPRRKK